MPFDPGLAERLAALIGLRPDMEEKKMFGGIGWLMHGNMCVGVYREFLIVRVGEKTAEAILTEEAVRPMDITGKAMKGWAMIGPDGVEDDEALARYTRLAIDFVTTLPPK